MLTCGLVRTNWLLAMMFSRSLLDVRQCAGAQAVARRIAPEPRVEQPPFPRVLLLVGKGQLRVSRPSTKSAHPGATDGGSCGPGTNMTITLAVNLAAGDRISRRRLLADSDH